MIEDNSQQYDQSFKLHGDFALENLVVGNILKQHLTSLAIGNDALYSSSVT